MNEWYRPAVVYVDCGDRVGCVVSKHRAVKQPVLKDGSKYDRESSREKARGYVTGSGAQGWVFDIPML